MTGPDKKTVALVIARDDRCLWCGAVNYEGSFQIHHRRARGQGGSRRADTNGPQNLVCICFRCHGHVESHRDEARQRGFLVSQASDPLMHPVRDYVGRWWFLLPDGRRDECTMPEF